MKIKQTDIKFCWLCSKQLYQRKVGVFMNIDGHRRVLHVQCAKRVDTGGDFIKRVTYHSAEWRES